jgi:hypothetical protein
LFFEGVYTTLNRLSSRNTKVMLLMIESPLAESFRSKGFLNLAALTYRVADGCGVGVIPSPFAWNDVLKHNILSGKSLLKSRANSFLAAASVWCCVTDKRVPKGALSTDWVVKKTATKMAASARDAVDVAIQKKHYIGPFKGVVRMEARMQRGYMVYQPVAALNPDLQTGLEYIFNAAGQGVVQRSTADWYNTGFDRHSAAFDLVYGSVREMELFQDEKKYTSTEYISENMPDALRAVYIRNPANDKDGSLTLKTLENVLMEGYDFAREHNCVFIPFQIAWARALSANPEYIKTAPGKSSNDWISYMLANMLYSSLTGTFQLPTQREKPHLYNQEHPRGYHSACAKIGWQCMRQLSELSTKENTVVVGSESWFVDKDNPGFLRLRLLEPPRDTVRVLCEPNALSTIQLSRNLVEFTPDNYDIEQTIRCDVVSAADNVFCSVLVRAESKDIQINGVFTKKPFLLNYNEDKKQGFVIQPSELTLTNQSYVMLTSEVRPVDIVKLQVIQHGVETASVDFCPEFYADYPLCLFPTKADLQKGECRVILKASSKDHRFNNFEREYLFKLNMGGVKIPDVKMVVPQSVKGPAFVTAEAVADGVKQSCQLSIFCGKKRLGMIQDTRLQRPVEMGPPQSRLLPGNYPLWAAVRLKNGLVVASDVSHLSVTKE